jgi:hypothetical protein
MVDAQTVGVLVTAASVTVAAIYYIFTLRMSQNNMKTTLETRQAQLFMDVYNKFSSKEFTDDMNRLLIHEAPRYGSYEEFQEKYGYEKNPQYYASLMRMGMTIEGVGVLVKKGLIDVGLVDDLMSFPIMRFWELTSRFWVEYRVRENFPNVWEFVEYLYNEINPIFQKQHPGYNPASSQ